MKAAHMIKVLKINVTRLYRLPRPVEYRTGKAARTTAFVVVSTLVEPPSSPSTLILPSDASGNILAWCEIESSFCEEIGRLIE